jgi:hypothetical protein
MDWENRLKELSGYDISFEIKQGYYHIALKYDDGWDVLIPDNENIYVEKRNGVYHYIASVDTSKIEDLFKSIDATIDYNMDLQKKLILFKQKTEELQALFADEEYEKLQTIKFVFEETTPKKRQNKAKVKTETKGKSNKKQAKKKTKDKDEKTPLESVNEAITQVETTDYDDNDEVVTMSGEYFEELERK